MTEMVKSGSMSGEEKRSDGSLGEDCDERSNLLSAPPTLHATALVLDSTTWFRSLELRLLCPNVDENGSTFARRTGRSRADQRRAAGD